ncbi:FAD-binding oxidoreductase [Candidatus Saccharibacteria bacterium]|nr:FAD-binding oxidoreductase [Candidatus Saccharibacteria bacterium]
MDIEEKLKQLISGDVNSSQEIREKYSHDASMFELKPQLVVAPKDAQDVKAIVKLIASQKQQNQNLSLTVRSAGTDMSGAAINDSIILDFTKYFTNINEVSTELAHAQPGVYYRDFEKATLEKGVIMPSYPASRDLCTIGGMVANNAGGEKSLKYGKTEEFVEELSVVLADGNQYTVKALNKDELEKKMAQNDFEGRLYKDIFTLIDSNYDQIKAAKPGVSKDSTGYHLWNVWDQETGVFDMTRLITGSQGTLGIITDIKLRLVPAPKHTGTLVIFLRSLDDLGQLIVDVMKHKPSSFEGFDNYTLMLSFRLFIYFYKTLGWPQTLSLVFQLIPDALKLLRGIPKMVLLVEFEGESEDDTAKQVHELRQALSGYNHQALFEEDETEAKSRKFWIMRRESFNLLRNKVHDKHTAPFMDDLVVPPAVIPDFLPAIRAVIKKYKLLATIAGHFGDGNFHIIPLMNIENLDEKAKLEPAMREINTLVLKYKGSLSGEHNDGMIRGPWLEDMYGPEVFAYFKQVKHIFDPDNIFNPHKKTDSDWDYSMEHLRDHF